MKFMEKELIMFLCYLFITMVYSAEYNSFVFATLADTVKTWTLVPSSTSETVTAPAAGEAVTYKDETFAGTIVKTMIDKTGL